MTNDLKNNVDISQVFDAFRKINGSLTQKQVDSINTIIEMVSIDTIYAAVGLGTTMKISNDGLKLIQSFEGYRSNAYDDGVGVWTIGYGTTKYPNGERVKKGDVCTLEQANQYMAHDLKAFEDAINALVKIPLKQNQYDALVSLCYNIGITNFSKSTLLKNLNANNIKSASEQFLSWSKAGGKVMQGLLNRRKNEKLFFDK